MEEVLVFLFAACVAALAGGFLWLLIAAFLVKRELDDK